MELHERKCPVCASADNTHLYGFVREFNNGPTVRRCEQCDSVFLNPVMTQRAYSKFYSNDEQKKFAQNITKDNYNAKILQNDLRKVDLVKKHVERTGKILDVGTGCSKFVGIMGNAVGIDISEERIKEAQEMGLPVRICEIDNWNEKVDTVTLFHLLEHIIDPAPFLRRIYDILSIDGTLVIEVPNLSDVLVELDRYKGFYYQNAHCSYFTPNTLKKLLKVANFEVKKEIKIQRYSFDNHMHWLLKGKPGKFSALGFVNPLYSWVLKKLNVHDTIFLVCKKR